MGRNSPRHKWILSVVLLFSPISIYLRNKFLWIDQIYLTLNIILFSQMSFCYWTFLDRIHRFTFSMAWLIMSWRRLYGRILVYMIRFQIVKQLLHPHSLRKHVFSPGNRTKDVFYTAVFGSIPFICGVAISCGKWKWKTARLASFPRWNYLSD